MQAQSFLRLLWMTPFLFFVPALSSSQATPEMEALARSTLADLPLQAANLNGGEAPEAPDASAGRTNFQRLFGVLLNPDSITSDEKGKFKISYGPRNWLSVATILAEPVLRDNIVEALDNDAEQEALDDLDLGDDVTVEGKVRLLGSKREEDISKLLADYLLAGQEESFEELDRQLQEEDERLLRDPRVVLIRDRLRQLEAERTQAESRSDLAEAERLGAQIERLSGELEELIARPPVAVESAFASFMRVLKETRGKELLRIYRAKLNRPQLHLTGRYRWADELIAPNALSIGFTLEWGLPILPSSPDVERLESIASKKTHSFAVEGVWDEKDRIVVLDHPAFNQGSFEEAKLSFNWTTKVMQNLLRVDDTPVGGNQSLTLTYLRPNGDFNNERWTVNETLTFFLTDTISLPLSLTYSNHQETIEEDELRGKIGFSFSLEKKAEK